ncbi:MAG: GvpL/GvpF family gas vesicle protein [Planctomycetota bacterium]
MNDQRVIQLVAVCTPGTLTDVSGEGYAESSAPEIITTGDFDAVVVRVQDGLLTGDAGEKRLADVTWLTPRAAAHERIILRAMQRATVMPIGFGSVFSSEARLSDALAQHTDEINRFLESATDTVEWSIKALADREKLIGLARDDHDAQTPEPTTGAAYLDRKRHDIELKEHAEDLALETLDRFVDQIEHTVTDVTERERATSEATGEPWLVAHLALLVHRENTQAFNDAIDAAAPLLDPLSIDIEVSGPWPCYSFCPRLGAEDTNGIASDADLEDHIDDDARAA